MSLSPEEQRLRDQFLKTLTAAVLPLQPGADPEVTLEALIDAAGLLQEHFSASWQLREEQTR